MPAPIGGAGGAVLTPGVSPVLGGPGPGGPSVLGLGGPAGMLRGPWQVGPGYLPSIWPVQPPYLPLGPLPCILTPGIGPNGIGPIDARKSVYSVGEASTVPYGPTNGYATPNGVTGFIGPAAGSLRRPTTWYVRATGADTNGGTSNTTSPERNGTDGVINNTTTFTSATAAFTSADVGKGINIQGAGGGIYKIASVTNATAVLLSNAAGSNASGRSWAIGGALATLTNLVGGLNQTTITSGDTVYIGAGTYRAVYSLTLTSLAFNGQAQIVGDVTGQFTGDAGMVQLTAYTTNDKTAPSGTTLLNLNGKSNMTFQNIMFTQGSGTILLFSNTEQNITFKNCAFYGNAPSNAAFWGFGTTPYGFYYNFLFDSCFIFSPVQTSPMSANVTSGAASTLSLQDWNVGFVIQNCFIYSNAGNNPSFRLNVGGGGNGLPGGLALRNSTIFGQCGVLGTTANTSKLFPCLAIGNFTLTSSNQNLIANSLGQLVEDYNLLSSNSPQRTNVAAGAHSVAGVGYAPLFHFGQERIWLPPLSRAFGEPMAGSPLLGFGGDGALTYDMRGPFNPRPAGGSSGLTAAGAFERADTFVTDPTPIGNNTTPVKLTGPGYNDFLLPIGLSEVGQARTVSVAVQWDANYGCTPLVLPTLQMEAKPQMGVSQQSVSATGISGSPHTITLATFTPTAAGVLNIRALSYDTSGTSVVEFDSFTVT